VAILDIVTVPDHRLGLKSRPIEQVTDEIRALANDMAETMYAAPGVGLAAIQVGVPLQLVVIDVSGGEEKDSLYTLLNARIVENEGKTAIEEGCLSVPGVWYEVDRFETITVEYMDLEGRWHRMTASDMLAIVIQHELDHTRGMLFIDHLSGRQRTKALKKSRDFQREEWLKARREH